MASNEVLPFPCVSAETLEWCALIGLHLLAADCEVGSSGSQSLDLGDLWRYSYPKKAVTGTATWTESEGTSSSEQCEHNVSEIPSKRSLARQTVLCQEHSVSASPNHVQHHRLIQSTVWTCALTVQMRKVAWFHVRAACPLWEIPLCGPV